jgi:hypothetical protein
MGDKTGDKDWDDFKEEQAAIEDEMDQLDAQIDELEDSINKGEG